MANQAARLFELRVSFTGRRNGSKFLNLNLISGAEGT